MSISFAAAGGGRVEAITLQLSTEELQLENITNEILRKEIDFERSYLKYRVLGTKEPKYRRLRYYLLQVASSSTTLASSIMYLKLGVEGLRSSGSGDFGRAGGSHADEVSTSPKTRSAAPSAAFSSHTNRFSKLALINSLLGTAFDASSSLIELSSNSLTAYKNWKNGRSPNAVVMCWVCLVGVLDQLATERDAIIQRHPEWSASNIYKAEGRVLKCFRDWCLSEFADVYAEVKSTQASSNVYYVLDIMADVLYITASVLFIKAITPNQGFLAGRALNIDIVADSISMVTAPVYLKSSKLLYKYWRARLESRLNQALKDSERRAKAAMIELNQELSSPDIGLLEATNSAQNRALGYALWSSRYDKVLDAQLNELRHQARISLQDAISGPILAGMNMGGDVLADVAVYHLANRPKAAASVAVASSICFTSSAAGSLLLTNWYLFAEMVHRRHLRKIGQLPEQLLAERLKTLDELDAMLAAKTNVLQLPAPASTESEGKK